MNPLRFLILAAALSIALAGCRSGDKGPDPVWQRAEVRASSENFLWVVTRACLESRGYPLGGGIDPAAMVARTGWRTQLAPFRGQGVRHRAEVRFEPVGPDVWAVEVRVQQQANMDIVRPLDPTYAEWEWRPDDVEEARVVLQRLRSQLDQELDVNEPRQGRRQPVRRPG